jgi:hypothetical protein
MMPSMPVMVHAVSSRPAGRALMAKAADEFVELRVRVAARRRRRQGDVDLHAHGGEREQVAHRIVRAVRLEVEPGEIVQHARVVRAQSAHFLQFDDDGRRVVGLGGGGRLLHQHAMRGLRAHRDAEETARADSQGEQAGARQAHARSAVGQRGGGNEPVIFGAEHVGIAP